MDTKKIMIASNPATQCKSIYQNQECVLAPHIGTKHWNGETDPKQTFRWTDSDVILELQERIQNLIETNGLYLT